MSGYFLLDSGHEKKLEAFGPYRLIRPCPQAIWQPSFPKKWEEHQGEFTRIRGSYWKNVQTPPSWELTFEKLRFKLMLTDFGHLGVFPEYAMVWKWVLQRALAKKGQVLNLFAYSGGATMVLARQGISVCHLDASKGMVNWARENIALNGLEEAPIRWVVDDAIKFLRREVKRKVRYRAILLAPPSFGRGSQGQVFKIERDLIPLLHLCREVVSSSGFIVLTAHTPGLTPIVLKNVLVQTQSRGRVEAGEMLISSSSLSLPSGCYARWCG